METENYCTALWKWEATLTHFVHLQHCPPPADSTGGHVYVWCCLYSVPSKDRLIVWQAPSMPTIWWHNRGLPCAFCSLFLCVRLHCHLILSDPVSSSQLLLILSTHPSSIWEKGEVGLFISALTVRQWGALCPHQFIQWRGTPQSLLETHLMCLHYMLITELCVCVCLTALRLLF